MDGSQDVHFVEHEVRPGRAVSLADAMYTISPEYPRNPRFVFTFFGCKQGGLQLDVVDFGRKGLPVVIKNGFEGTNFDAPALRLSELAIEDEVILCHP
jgi:hypothetical protein